MYIILGLLITIMSIPFSIIGFIWSFMEFGFSNGEKFGYKCFYKLFKSAYDESSKLSSFLVKKDNK